MRISDWSSDVCSSDLKRIMHISDALAELNAGRYSDFFDQPERPAIYAFSGDVYVGFEAGTLPPESIDFAQDHVRILSGLYGLLRPLDSIRPYRLEMGTRWAPKAKNLYGYWGDRIRSEEHTSELQSLMRISYAVFCLKKKTEIPYLQ